MSEWKDPSLMTAVRLVDAPAEMGQGSANGTGHDQTPRSGLAAYQKWTRGALCKARYMCNIGHA